ncbi:hypothetical protein CKAH01_03718 [Colletotrichum kahawae]|uniref:Nephrocystin 3-like N-terminal domain-containing protein n=1 Tax=Colletotrichum kahawae TaxID=34407 RepID=A0AAD9YTC1_COLKA|nr:hypothetical protein CKAH01_03718 [Colletotrichum kahawae]
MKLVYEHETVRKMLGDWASNCKLLYGGFFFWRKGEPHQKEVRGIYRGLLYSVLKSHRELVPKLLPSCWSETFSTPWQAQMNVEISERDIKDGVARLIDETATGGRYRLFLLIDGLDEMEVTTNNTYRHLVQVINGWTNRGSQNMKICVSSRDDAIFRDNLIESQRLRLHHVTKLDMQQVARERLSLILGANINEISNAIVDRAQGIFFWVTLVLTTILQLENDARMDEVLEQINQLPDELSDLFSHIIKSLEKTTRRYAYQTLALMQEAQHWGTWVPAIGYSFLSTWTKSGLADFAMSHIVAEPLSPNVMIDRARRDVRRCCKGLVEVRGSTLDYTHRSVGDFTQEPSTKEDMGKYLHGFNVRDALSQLIILAGRLEARTGNIFRNAYQQSREDISRSLIAALSLRQESHLDTKPYSLLERMDDSDQAIVEACWSACREESMREFEILYHARYGYSAMVTFPLCRGKYNGTTILNPAFILILQGKMDYPIWKTRRRTAKKQSNLRISLLVCSALTFHLCRHPHRSPAIGQQNMNTGPDIIEALFSHDNISPNTEMECLPVGISIHQLGPDSLPTVFQVVVMVAAIVAGGQDKQWIGKILEILVQRGADLDFTLSTGKKEKDEPVIFLRRINASSESHSEICFVPGRIVKDNSTIIELKDCGPDQIIRNALLRMNIAFWN